MGFSGQAGHVSQGRSRLEPCSGADLGHTRRPHGLLLGVAALAMLFAVAILAGCGASSSTTSASGTAMKTATVAGVQIATDPALAATLPEKVKASGVLRVAMNIPYPPWEMYVSEGSNEVTGLDWDLSQALATKLGVTASAIQMPFDSMIPSVQADKADVVISDLSDTKERQATVDFVDYALDSIVILVLKGNPQNIASVDDLSGKRVIVNSGSSQASWALKTVQPQFKAAGKPPMQLIQLPNSPALTLGVKAGKGDASLMDLSAAAWAAKSYDNGNAFEVVIDPKFPNGYNPAPVGIGVSKKNTQLRDSMQKALQALIDDGAYAKIMEKWGLGAAAVQSAQLNQGT
ncbi:ABC transporter substrate-binding protein [Candidatus Cryosericum septentrionale]|uniref:ABC transporter substrate-binding protein n=1 Tax=Candidatus Cryosericum septentrionale TaxID=2290913 RepID=A0A398DUR1_9BACT|nr:ABC transporter substrate-binding protein [Candidatus Cryosericum septentrionale]RIE15828.1 ABC transporter substrate-binding protein [Candidatus Cryosericum septentrionale]